jgi:hypothetical protein
MKKVSESQWTMHVPGLNLTRMGSACFMQRDNLVLARNRRGSFLAEAPFHSALSFKL